MIPYCILILLSLRTNSIKIKFVEYELTPSGKLRYANNSNYKSDTMIRKEVFVSPAVVDEVKRIIVDSEITKEGMFAHS